MQEYDIRSVDDANLNQALQLVSDVFMEYEAPEYSEEDIAEFLRFIDYDSIKGMLNSGDLMMWACFEGDCVCGVLAVRPPGHISLMFVDSRSHHKGIARALFEYTLAQLHITEERITMTVNSSPYAVGFYQKMGFKETDSEQTVNGIRFIPMKRPV